MYESTHIPYAFEIPVVDCDLAPGKSHVGDAGWDLRAAANHTIFHGETHKIATGIRVAIPTGFVGMVCSRSGLAADGVFVVNAPGIIDSGYRGEIAVILHNLGEFPQMIRKGDRIAQLLIMEVPNTFFLLQNRKGFDGNQTERGESGFGSTGLA